jgi:hypothetical protein
MAVLEYEPRFDPAVTEEEISPLDYFKAGLHGMVAEVESSGISALGHLLAVRSDLRQKQIHLMRESFSDNHTPEELVLIQEEMILIYHEQIWAEGYIADRQPK